MNTLPTRWMLTALVLALAAFLCLIGQHEYNWFGAALGSGGLLLWPGTLLAHTGAVYTWVVVPVVGIVLVTTVTYSTRTRHWLATASLGGTCGITYIAVGAIALKVYPVTLPEPPYGTDSEKSEQYLSAYEAGYRSGVGGVLRTYCFSPEAETQGFYEGMQDGWAVLNRTVGVRVESDNVTIVHVMAARDGVTLDTEEELSEKTPNRTPSSIGSGLD